MDKFPTIIILSQTISALVYKTYINIFGHAKHLVTSSHYHNTRSSHLLNLPPVKSSYGQRAFSFSGASLWQSLPSYVYTSKSIKEFSRFAAHNIFNELVAYFKNQLV